MKLTFFYDSYIKAMANPTLFKNSINPSDESVKNEKDDKNLSINNLMEDVFR